LSKTSLFWTSIEKVKVKVNVTARIVVPFQIELYAHERRIPEELNQALGPAGHHGRRIVVFV
jgi:hypothetical protein